MARMPVRPPPGQLLNESHGRPDHPSPTTMCGRSTVDRIPGGAAQTKGTLDTIRGMVSQAVSSLRLRGALRCLLPSRLSSAAAMPPARLVPEMVSPLAGLRRPASRPARREPALTIPITPELSVFSLTLGSHEQEFRHRFDVVRDRAGGRWRHPEGGYLGALLWIQHPQGRRCPAAGRGPSRHLGPHHRENGGQEPRQNPNIGPRTRLIEPPPLPALKPISEGCVSTERAANRICSRRCGSSHSWRSGQRRDPARATETRPRLNSQPTLHAAGGELVSSRLPRSGRRVPWRAPVMTLRPGRGRS
jgi:hypothetical protein